MLIFKFNRAAKGNYSYPPAKKFDQDITMEDDVTIYMWWGIDADVIDVETWHSFQEQISRALEGKVQFIEVQTEDAEKETVFRLETEGWSMARGGSGAFSRMIPWSKRGNSQ